MDTKDIEQNNFLGSNVAIRPAYLNDVEDIITLNRNSFPDSLKERAPSYYLKKWWVFLIDSPSVEVYVITSNKIIVGFAVLVINEDNYKKESKLYKLPKHVIIYTLLTSPQCLFHLPQKIIARLKSKFIYKKLTQNNIENNIHNRTWLELITISKEYRGMGLAKLIIDFLEKRTIKLNRNILALAVSSNNHKAISLYTSLHFFQSNHVSNGSYIYKKILNT